MTSTDFPEAVLPAKLSPDDLIFNEFSRLNNELMTAYRMEAKHNAELQRLNDELAKEVANRKRCDEALKTSLFRYKSIIDGTNVGTWEWNIKTGESTLNETWAAMLGYSPDEVEPNGIWTWANLRHPDDVARCDDLLDRHLRRGLPYYDSEYRMRHKNGSWVWIHARGRVASRDELGNPLMMYGTHMDITERKKAEEELRQALLKNQSLLRELQHRAKNSFNIILALIGVSEEAESDVGTSAVLEELRARVVSIAELYELLYVSETSSEVALDDYCRKVTAAMRLMTRSIVIEESLEKVTIPVSTAVPVGLILTELLTNSFKYAYPKGRPGTVVVSLRSIAGGALLLVSDDGAGLSVGFDPATCPGTGLKLINGLVKQIGGKLEITKQKQGSGFSVKIPIQ